jgi:hypothetical protein
MQTIDFEAHQWPAYLDEPPPFPNWLQSALLIGDLRVSDDLGHVKTPEGELTIHPGDWIVKTSNGLFAVWSNDLYHAFMNSADERPADPHNAQLEGADQPDEPDTDAPDPNSKAA